MGNQKKVALIGGGGFIGHNLALFLKSHNYVVDVIDSFNVNNLLNFVSNPKQDPAVKTYYAMLTERVNLLNEAGIPIHLEDARDYHRMAMCLNKIKPDVVIVLAAIAHANKSNKDPFSTFDHSLRTLENALDYSKGSIEHFIYFSSSMVYGHFTDGAVSEESPCDPLGIYGSLKFAGEKIVKAYGEVFDLPYTIIRPSALYGERCVSRRVGQIFIENALQGKEITIQGQGDDRLDFTYIGDLVEGIKCVIEHPEARNQIFNMTYGDSRSISQLAEIIKQHFPKVNIRFEAKDKHTPDRGTLNVDRARNLIGYKPKFPVEIGYVKYIEWYKKFWQKHAG